MAAAVAYVTAHPGTTMGGVVGHLLEGLPRDKPTVYKQAASVVERIIRDRLVRQDAALRLHPWDTKRKTFAEALERAAFAAPDAEHWSLILALAMEAWRLAGDENRVRILGGLTYRERT